MRGATGNAISPERDCDFVSRPGAGLASLLPERACTVEEAACKTSSLPAAAEVICGMSWLTPVPDPGLVPISVCVGVLAVSASESVLI